MALLVVLMAVTLLAALGGGLGVLVRTELQVAAHYRDGLQVFYAADGLLEVMLADLADAPSVDHVLNGRAAFTLLDGAAGARTVGSQVVNLAAPPRPVPGITGPNAPQWRAVAHGWADHLMGTVAGAAPVYLAAWIGDDPFEVDGNPLRDGGAGAATGQGVVAVHVRAYGVTGARRAIDAIIGGVPASPRLLSWREGQ